MEEKSKKIPRLFHKLDILFKEKEEFFSPSINDIYLVSYPRSGSTWLRVMLAEIMFGRSGDSLMELLFFMPEIGETKYIGEVIRTKPYIVKTHENFSIWPQKKNIKKVIYLIRDPRDVLISWYRFQSARFYKFDFDQFMLDALTGRMYPGSWQNHVDSWTEESIRKHDLDICLIKYEDLINDNFNELQKIIHFIGIDRDNKKIQEAIDKSSKEIMKKKEQLGLWKGAQYEKMKFIGQATSGQWKESLSDVQVKFVVSYTERQMKRFGYLD